MHVVMARAAIRDLKLGWQDKVGQPLFVPSNIRVDKLVDRIPFTFAP